MKWCVRLMLGLVLLSVPTGLARGNDADLSEYRAVTQAIPAKSGAARAAPALGRPGYLGVSVTLDAAGRLVIGDVAGASPAAEAGVRAGDVVHALDGKPVFEETTFLELLGRCPAGTSVRLALTRAGKPLDVTPRLVPLSRPLNQAGSLAFLGVEVAPHREGLGMAIAQVVPGSPAEKVQLKAGDVLLKVDDVALTGADVLRNLLAAKKPGDVLTLVLGAAEKTVQKKVKLAGTTESPAARQPQGWDTRGKRGSWNKPVYRLGIICVEYPDQAHNPKIPPKAWEKAMFSKGIYKGNSPTGQTVYGSMADHYLEQSFGKLRIEGKAFAYVQVKKKRGEYATGNRSALLTEALDLIVARDGMAAFKDLDGVFFLYAGARYQAPRGSLYWPHRGTLAHNGKRWPYFICPEGGERMGNISVFSHEFGHMLGLPDLYARPENPGMEGVGVWCLMANQVGNGRPQHMSAWSKERLGWIQPTVIDPTVKQKLILRPIEDDPRECIKILLRPDGSEYYLLENRAKRGFDQSLPAEGLLIWRVLSGRPVLEESHGVAGPAGPSVFLNAVPYPSAANNAFTPFTMPSSRSQLGDGPPVYVTNIRRLPDGRVTFHVGYEYH
jgi:M6 family metalloprotease-like protein